MRVTLIRPNGKEYSIDSFNADTITVWLEEWFPRMLADRLLDEWKLRIWATTHDEQEAMGARAMVQEMTTLEGFRKLENFFRRKANGVAKASGKKSGAETIKADKRL